MGLHPPDPSTRGSAPRPQAFPQLQICHYTTDTDDIVLLMLFSGDTSADESEFKAPTAKQTKKTEANLKCDDQSIEVSR